MSKLKVYTDESCLNDQFLGYGGIFILEKYYVELENLLNNYANSNGFNARELSYKKCSKTDIDRHIGITKIFFDYLQKKKMETNHWVADFRSLIINTKTNQIHLNNETWEVGFYKFYFQFITKSIFNLSYTNDTEFEFNIAEKSDSYKFRTEVLQNTITGALKKRYSNKCTVNEIKRGKPKESRVHQVADILLGCVTYRFNNKNSESKENLVKYIENRINSNLNLDFKPIERPFNVWGFSSRGQERWVKGSSGVVLR